MRTASAWSVRESSSGLGCFPLYAYVELRDTTGNVITGSYAGNQPVEVIAAVVPPGTYVIRILPYSLPYSPIYGIAWSTQ